MNVSLEIDADDRLIVHLLQGPDVTTVSVRPSKPGARSLMRALDAALAEGYGECFWPGDPGGQYWWIFKRNAETLETVALWTRGGASLWEHVFRATDEADWVHERVAEEIARVGL